MKKLSFWRRTLGLVGLSYSPPPSQLNKPAPRFRRLAVEQYEDRVLLAMLSLGPDNLHGAEGSVATLQVTTSQPSMQPTPFTFRTVSGTAIGGTDYQDFPSGSGTIQPYATFANVSIQAINDYFTDIGETFSVELLTATGATINPAASSVTVTIDDVAAGGGGSGGGSTTLTLSVPANVNEGDGFLLTAQLSTPGYYQINVMVDWGATPGAGPVGFSGTTSADGSFTIGHQYFDDGPAPGNGTPQDVQSITLTGTATQFTPQGPVYYPLSGVTSTTIHNVAPNPVFDIYNYMPIGGSDWVASFTYQDVGLTDLATFEINWGDGSPSMVGSGLEVGDTLWQVHRYPPDGLAYTITMTITDDDTGVVTYSEGFGLYLFDLDNDANNNGEIAPSDECYEPPTPGPGRYISVNADDDNENLIPDMDETGPILGEDDLEPFLVRWIGIRPDINDYYGWHITLRVPYQEPDQYYVNPRIWLSSDKSGSPLQPEYLADGYEIEWTIGVDPIPTTLYLEARTAASIGMRLRLWTPTWESVERYKREDECCEGCIGEGPWEYTIIFTTVPVSEVNMQIWDGQYKDGDKAISNAAEDKTGAVTVANKNDTDADGKPDFEDDNGVIETRTGDEAQGRDEVDLMRLVVYRPPLYTDGDVVLTVIKKPENVKMWSDSTKKTPLPEYDAATGKATFNSWPVTVKYKIVWLELIVPSTIVGDVKLKLTYKDYIPDEVWATGVWSTLAMTEFGTKEWDKGPVADRLGAPWTTEMDQRLKNWVKIKGGTGVREEPLYRAATVDDGPTISYYNVILFQFTVFPENVTEILSRVQFDAARQSQGHLYKTLPNGTIEIIEPMNLRRNPIFPKLSEQANDDKHNKDESDKPIKGHFYDVDGPGLGTDFPPLETDNPKIQHKYNFREYMRVGFKERPSGDTVAGSQTSEKYPWHTWTTLEKKPDKYERFGGPAANNINDKHIEIGDQP